jgi:signal transduction histidine kinase
MKKGWTLSMHHIPPITLADLRGFDHAVHPERAVRDVFELFAYNPRLPGVLVMEGGRFITALSRVRLLELMRRRFSYELFWDRPLTEVLDRWMIQPTVLEAHTCVAEAISAALVRTDDTLAEPVVCRDISGRHTLLDMHTLLTAQCSELAVANERLAEAHRESGAANRAKTDFLANMSHEIRTPMTAILGYAEVLQDSALDSAQRAAAARTIRRSGEHLLSLLNDVLDLSKIEAGRFSVDPADHDPGALLRETVELFRARAGEKGVELVLSIEGGLPPLIRSDPTRLRQILSNLIGNAIKFTAAGGVYITARLNRSAGPAPADAVLEVGVKDTGIGIGAGSIENLFQPFVQADTSMSRRFGGTGLGLTISRRLARMMGGDIVVTSAEGRGSLFVVTVSAGLDRVAAQPVEPVVAAASPGAPGRIAANVLLADDGVDNQRLFAFHLTGAGAAIDIASDGAEAVAMASVPGARYDLILMDMQMPGVDGYQATRTLRQRGYAGPILALTAHAMAADRERAITAGCDGYLTKPITREALIAACVEWTSRPVLRQAA